MLNKLEEQLDMLIEDLKNRTKSIFRHYNGLYQGL